MSRHELAQLNVAATKAPLDSPLMAEFAANLARINELAEHSPGFVWRLKNANADPTASRLFGGNVLVNMSVWKDVEALRTYAFTSEHLQFLRRRREWFDRIREAYAALWWVPQGHQPSLAEAAERLAHLRKTGPSPRAFTFGEVFLAPDSQEADTYKR
jgi:hypothetical protein